MTKTKNLILSFGAIIGGWILCAFAWTTTMGHPTSSLCLVLGLVFSVIGFISLILVWKKD